MMTRIVIFVLIVSGCQYNLNTKKGKIGYSYSIVDAKERGVFRELICHDVQINDSLTVQYAWLESRLKYTYNIEMADTIDGFQTIIQFKESKMLDDYQISWKIVSARNIFRGLGKVGDQSCYLEKSDTSDLDFFIVSGIGIVRDSLDFQNRVLSSFTLE